MNYIKRLEDDNLKLKQALRAAIGGMRDLMGYCNSDKFYGDNYVNVSDIVHRTMETLNDVNDITVDIKDFKETLEPIDIKPAN